MNTKKDPNGIGLQKMMMKIITKVGIQPNLLDYRHLVNELICSGFIFN